MLQAAVATSGRPAVITVDNGTEFTSKALDAWAYWNGYNWPSAAEESRLITRWSKPSTDPCGVSACHNTGLFRSRKRNGSSRPGGRTTTTRGRIAACRTSLPPTSGREVSNPWISTHCSMCES